jgi:hypothetical protein
MWFQFSWIFLIYIVMHQIMFACLYKAELLSCSVVSRLVGVNDLFKTGSCFRPKSDISMFRFFILYPGTQLHRDCSANCKQVSHVLSWTRRKNINSPFRNAMSFIDHHKRYWQRVPEYQQKFFIQESLRGNKKNLINTGSYVRTLQQNTCQHHLLQNIWSTIGFISWM